MAYRYNRRCRCNGSDGNEAGIGCLIIAVLALMAMPLVGLWMLLTGKDVDKKGWGIVLLVIGIILWIVVAVNR